MTGRMPRDTHGEAAEAPEPVAPAPPAPATTTDTDATKPPVASSVCAPCDARRKRRPKFVL